MIPSQASAVYSGRVRHRQRHPSPVEGCFGCKALTLHIAPAAMAARVEDNREYTYQRRLEAENNTDRDAYARLRRNGLQPKSIAGSARLEAAAATPFEVASGQLFTGRRAQAQLGEALAMCTDAGVDVTVPTVSPKIGGG